MQLSANRADPNLNNCACPHYLEVCAEESFAKRFVHKDRGLQVEDKWTSVSGSTQSYGRTVITRDGIPVWYMQYAGWYEDAATPHLKAALTESYRDRMFIGGRGPRRFDSEKLIYRNVLGPNSGFTAFHGREFIRARDNGAMLGVHYYSGGVM